MSDRGIQGSKGTALITGASTGIGAQYAEQLADRGYDVILVARNRERMDALASKLTTSTRRAFEVVQADLATSLGVSKVEEILKSDKRVSMIVNNAGFGSIVPTLDADPAVTQSMIDLNITAVARLSIAAARAFVAQGRGAIVQISSVVALQPHWMNGVYGATKAFVLAYSETLRHELKDKGVKVQVVIPGTTSTEFWDVAGRPTSSLPDAMTMSAAELVEAALSGFDQGEFVTIPSLPDLADWDAYDTARNALAPNLSRNHAAKRYAVTYEGLNS